MIVGVAVGAVFRFVPTRAEPEDQPSTADLVDRCRPSSRSGRDCETMCRARSGRFRPAIVIAATARDDRPALPRADRFLAGVGVEQMVGNPDRVHPGSSAIRHIPARSATARSVPFPAGVARSSTVDAQAYGKPPLTSLVKRTLSYRLISRFAHGGLADAFGAGIARGSGAHAHDKANHLDRDKPRR